MFTTNLTCPHVPIFKQSLFLRVIFKAEDSSIDKILALQAQGPEFNPQKPQQKKSGIVTQASDPGSGDMEMEAPC